MSLLLEACALSHVYPDGSVGLDGCSLAIRSGSRNALLGSNGSGKTSLLLHFNALLQPTAGGVRFAGQPVDYRRSGLNALRRRVEQTSPALFAQLAGTDWVCHEEAIRRLEADELGLPADEQVAPRVGRSNEGKPGTRKGRFGKQSKTKWGR